MGDETECRKAAKKAMDLLLRQDRTKKELQERLHRAGFSEEAAKYAIEYVEGFGYIDDARYAANYISLHKAKRSKKELRYKLTARGIPPEILVEAFLEYTPEDEEEALANQLKKQLRGKVLSEMSWEEKGKVTRRLAQKGYSLSSIKRIMQMN